MSESRYVDQIVRAFRRRYPPKAGWTVYQFDHMIGLNLLPAFIRMRVKEDILGEDVRILATLHEEKDGNSINYRTTPHIGRGSGLSDEKWFGKISLRWKGTPLHILRLRLVLCERIPAVTFVATKKRAALDDLAKQLLQFWREHYIYGSEPAIHITNTGGTIPLPKIAWSDLVIPDSMRNDIRQNVESFLQAKTHYQQMGLPFRRGFLFVGAPGGGKTTAAKAVMANSRALCLSLRLTDQLNDSMIETAFREASRESPAILLIEDLDKIIRSSRVSISFLLNLLDGLDSYEGFLLIATSNEPEKIDPALLHRPSRFDRVWHFGLPGQDERRTMLIRRSQDQFSRRAIEQAATSTEGMTLAFVQEVVVNALLAALHQGRAPEDTDLKASVNRLMGQFKSNVKVTGILAPSERVGFHTNGLATPDSCPE